MNQEELKQRLIELLVELYERERIVSFEQIAETFIANGVTIRERGEWEKLEGNWKDADTEKPLTIHQCSRCGSYFRNAPHNFCSYCGADMRGVKDE